MGLEIQSTTLLLVALVISFLLSFSISIVYFEYLKKGGSWRIAFQFFVFLPVLISLITIFYTAITSNPVTTVFYYFIFSFVLLLFVGKLPRFKCKKMKKIDKIENLPIFICLSPYNVLYLFSYFQWSRMLPNISPYSKPYCTCFYNIFYIIK